MMKVDEFYCSPTHYSAKAVLYFPKIKQVMASCHLLQYKLLLRDDNPFLEGRKHNFSFIISKSNNNNY